MCLYCLSQCLIRCPVAVAHPSIKIIMFLDCGKQRPVFIERRITSRCQLMCLMVTWPSLIHHHHCVWYPVSLLFCSDCDSFQSSHSHVCRCVLWLITRCVVLCCVSVRTGSRETFRKVTGSDGVLSATGQSVCTTPARFKYTTRQSFVVYCSILQ